MTLAFQGPNSSAGVGGGAIGVDASNDVSIGTSTPPAATKFTVVGSSTNATEYALKILQPNGTILVSVQNNGNVGIGTNQPSSTLHVVGSSTITGAVTFSALGSSGNPCLSVSSAGVIATTTCGGGGTVAASAVTAGTFGSGNFAFPSGLGVNTSTGVSLPANLTVYGTAQTTATTTLAINGGNVGIGTSTPDANLSLSSPTAVIIKSTSLSTTAGGGLIFYNNTNNNGQFDLLPSSYSDIGDIVKNSVLVYSDASSGIELVANNSTGPIKFGAGGTAEQMRLSTAGNLGIGSTGPGQRLTVVDAGNTNQYNGTVSVYANNLTQGVGIGYAGIQALGSNTNQDLSLNARGTGNITMQVSGATGNVGIGTTSPGHKLDFGSNTYIDNGVINDGAGTGYMYIGSLYDSGSNQDLVLSSGNVGVRTTPNSAIRFQVNPQTTSTGINWSAQINTDPSSWADSKGGLQVQMNNYATALDLENSQTPGSARTAFSIGEGGTQVMSVNWAGTLTATSKNFEIPYPEKPGYDLVHSTLEGPEVGVYYRGHGTLSNGAATITLPEYFNRLVREGSETVLLTAQSEQPFMLSYDSFDFADNKFEVHGTIPNGEFDWQVNATRADLPPLQVEKKTPVAP